MSNLIYLVQWQGKNYCFVCVCVCVMATNILELATTLKYLGAKWLPGKKVNFTPWNLLVTNNPQLLFTMKNY